MCFVKQLAVMTCTGVEARLHTLLICSLHGDMWLDSYHDLIISKKMTPLLPINCLCPRVLLHAIMKVNSLIISGVALWSYSLQSVTIPT